MAIYQAVKLMVVGSPGTGKSALVLRFVTDQFVEDYDPTMEDCYRKMGMIDSNQTLLEILDCYDAQEHNYMTPQYMISSGGFICVYSISDESSLKELQPFIGNIKGYTGRNDPLIIIGSKCDLECERRVTTDAGLRFAEKNNADGFYEVSAKYDINIAKVFCDLARKVIRKKKENTCAPAHSPTTGQEKKCVVS